MVPSEPSTRPIALGLLLISLFALGLGLFNTLSAPKASVKYASGKPEQALDVSSLLKKQQPHLQLLELTGMITMGEGGEGGLFEQESNAMTVRHGLEDAEEDNNVKGVLLRINSPGGTVAMSQELNEAVKRVSLKKPVVVSMGDLTASGGYYTACAADKIIANPGTLTASIGVIISTMNLSELLNNKLGVHAVTIKSGRFKDILSPYRTPTPADVQLIQTLIDDSYQDFLNTVVAGRTRFIKDAALRQKRIASIKAVADGRIVTGRQGLTAGLVDEIGDQEVAVARLNEMAKQRFHIKGSDLLPLETGEKRFDLAEWIGLNSKSIVSGLTATTPAGQLPRLPLSARYPNQLLWMME
jgi:protease IV